MATHSAFAEFLLNGKRFIKNSVRKNKRNDSREVKSKKENYVNGSNSLRASTLSIDVIKKKNVENIVAVRNGDEHEHQLFL